jgi:exosortase E/protease (VPEID-CTERM system)
LGAAAGSPAVAAPVSFTNPSLTRLVPRWAFFLLLLAAELVALTLPFDASRVLQHRSAIVGLIVALEGFLRSAFITGVAAIVFLSWDTARDEFIRVFHHSDDPAHTSFNFLRVHFIILVPLVVGTIARSKGYFADPTHPVWWLCAWMILGVVAAVTWGAAAMPGRFWARWYRRSPREFAVGAAFGAVATALGESSRLLWSPLRKSTFWAVSVLLSVVDRHAELYPQNAIIRTQTFAVRIGEACSGLEGIGLICAFLTLYLWFSRRQLRFPQALLLIPAGAAAIWILNAVRITALILIGSWNADVAIRGFHSVAGWLFFNLVAFGLVYSSSRMNLFSTNVAEPDRDRVSNPAAIYLAPMLTIVSAAMITQAFSAGFDFLYALRVIAVAAVLFYYRPQLIDAIRFTLSWQAIGLGAMVFAAWIAIIPADRAADAQFAGVLAAMSRPGATSWIAFRVMGAIVTVPIAEELAFRGYAIRKLISANFESVPPGTFTWLSFAVSSVLFGAVHGNWVAGTIAGGGFAIALYRRGALADAVVSHATANALLAAYVLATHRWSLWS